MHVNFAVFLRDCYENNVNWNLSEVCIYVIMLSTWQVRWWYWSHI